MKGIFIAFNNSMQFKNSSSCSLWSLLLVVPSPAGDMLMSLQTGGVLLEISHLENPKSTI